MRGSFAYSSLFPIVVSGMSASTDAGDILNVGVGAYAATRAEFTATGGGILDGTLAIPPVREYKRMFEWDPHEPSTRPDHFDAVAVVRNNSSATQEHVVVKIDVFARVGPITINESADAPDVQQGRQEATWSTLPFATQTPGLGTLHVGEMKSASIERINLKALIDALYAEHRWPYEMRIRAEGSCKRCETHPAVETRVLINLGD